MNDSPILCVTVQLSLFSIINIYVEMYISILPFIITFETNFLKHVIFCCKILYENIPKIKSCIFIQTMLDYEADILLVSI